MLSAVEVIMAEERFPLAPNDLRNTLARAVTPIVSPAAIAMIRSAEIVPTYLGHDGRGAGTDEWELRVMVPTEKAGSIEDMEALKAAIEAKVSGHMPLRHEVTSVIVLEAAEPDVIRVHGVAGIAAAMLYEGNKTIEGTFDEEDAAEWMAIEHSEAVERLLVLLRRFPDAAHHLRQGRKKAGQGLTSRSRFPLADEYDVQDLLWFALRMFYPKARREDPTPPAAGSGSRIDFFLVDPAVAIEVKFLRDGQRPSDIKDQLLRDLFDASKRRDVRDLIFLLVEAKPGVGQVLQELDGEKVGDVTAHVVRVSI